MGVSWIQPTGIISPPYLEVTLDNFTFLAGGCLAARWAVFWGSSQILAIFGEWRDRRATTLNFGRRMTKLAADFNFPKILMVIEDYWVPARIDRETADHAGWITEHDFFLLLLRYLSSKMKVKSSAKLVLSPSAPFPYLSIGSMEVQSRKHHFTFIPNTTCHPIKSSTALR